MLEFQFYAIIILVIIVGLIKFIESHVDKECKHQFNQDDVMNLKLDPKCVKCGKELSKCN
jgi:hypothetical protein